MIHIRSEIQSFDNEYLVSELNAHDVFFLRGGNHHSIDRLQIPTLLVALSASDEARLRLALIPLLLRHPEFAKETMNALYTLPSSAQLTLKCYYTAAVFLQQKYASVLKSLFQVNETLPDLFSHELGVPPEGNPEEHLQRLAERHQLLSDSYINWHGTYEHAVKRFIATSQKLRQWQH